MLTPENIQSLGQLPKANRQKLPLAPGDDVENTSWKNLVNLRLRVRGNNVFWVARGGSTLVNSFFGNVLTVKAINVRVGAVTSEYLVVHTSAGKVYLWDLNAQLSDEIASSGFSTTEQIQIINIGRFIYLFDYDGTQSKYYDLKEEVLHDYNSYSRAYIHTQSWLSEGINEDEYNVWDFKVGSPIIVFPNINFSAGDEIFSSSGLSDGDKDSFNPKNYNENSFYYNYNNGMYLEDSDGKVYKQSQFLTFRQNTDNFGFTVKGTGDAFTIDLFYIPLNEAGVPTFESYKAKIVAISEGAITWKDPVGSPQSASIGGITAGSEEEANMVFPYSADLEDLVGAPIKYRMSEYGWDIETNNQYTRPAIYRQYIVFDILKDGSVTQPGLPKQVKLDSTGLLIDGYTGVTLTTTTPDTAVAERYLAATRWHSSPAASFDPSTPEYSNSPLFIIGAFTTSNTIIRDRTPDSRLIRPVTEMLPMVGGVMDLFGPGELAPNSVARFRNSLMLAGYTVSRPVPVPYTDPSAPSDGNIFVDITQTTQLPNDMALAFMYEYSDGMKSNIVETEQFLQKGSVSSNVQSGCNQVKGTASHSLTNGVDYDGEIIVQYDGYQLTISLNTGSHGSANDAAEAIRAAIEANTNIMISAAVATAPQIDYTEERYGEEFNGNNIEYISVAPWDVGGATYLQTQATSANTSTDITLSADGTVMLEVDDVNDKVQEYTLTTAYDITTASATANSIDLSAIDTSPKGLTFADNGTKLIIVGDQNDSVYSIPLSTAYDITTAGVTVTLDVSTETTAPTGISMNEGGTTMYVLSTSAIFEYTLGTAYDITTASFNSPSFDLTTQTTSATGIFVKDNGGKLFVTDGSNVYEYHFGTAFTLSTLSYSGTSMDLTTQTTSATGLHISLGTHLYVIESSSGAVYQYDLPDGIGVTFDTNPVAIADASEPEGSKAYGWIAVGNNWLSPGENPEFNVTIDGVTTAANDTIYYTDTNEEIANKIKDLINNDPTLSADWLAHPIEYVEVDLPTYFRPAIKVESKSFGDAYNDLQFSTTLLTYGSQLNIEHGAPGREWSTTSNLTAGGADPCTSANAYIDVTANGLSGTTEDHTVTLDGVSTDPITITDSDTTEGIVDKYIAGIEANPSLDRLWGTEKLDIGTGSYRLRVFYRPKGEAFNGLVVDVTGDVAVTTSITSPTFGGTDSGDVPDAPAESVSANLIQIHSLTALINKVYVLGRTNDGTKQFHLISEHKITDPGAHGQVLELPSTEEALDEIELTSFQEPSATDIIETVELHNYVNVGTPAQQFNISTQEEIVDESKIIKAIPLEFDVDKSTMRYRVLIFTTQNIQIGYLVDATVGSARIFTGDFETVFEGLQASNRYGIERRNGLIIWSTNDSVYAWNLNGAPDRLFDRRRYNVSENNEHYDVAYNSKHNELWFIYRNNQIIILDLDTNSVRRMEYDSGIGTVRAGTSYAGNLYVCAGTDVLLTDQESVFTDSGNAISATAETDYIGDELSQIRILDLTIGGQNFQVGVSVDYQEERFVDVGTGWQDDFEIDQFISPKTINMAGKIYSIYRYAIMPRLKLSMDAISGGFLSHVILKYTPTENDGQAQE